jgi:hypothetical protein
LVVVGLAAEVALTLVLAQRVAQVVAAAAFLM